MLEAPHESIAPATSWKSSDTGVTLPSYSAKVLTTADGGDVHFSPQERRILRYLVEGRANKFIAREMRISDATVKVHVKAILRKIRVCNRTQAAIWAMNNEPLEFSASPTGNGHFNGEPRPN